MKIIIFISCVLLTSSGCFLNKNDINVINLKNTKTNYSSLSGRYLSANYAILKGDFNKAKKILKSKDNDLTLLKIEFYSNLVSGDFEFADNISKKINIISEEKFIYVIPKFATNLKKNNFKISLKIAENIQAFPDFNKIGSLISYWIKLAELKNNNKLYENNINNFQLSIYKLLILENFYNGKDLKKIADFNYNSNSLSNIELFFLAGFYFRYGDYDIFNNIIKNKVSDRFDKDYILKEFSNPNNLFSKKSNFQTVLSSYLTSLAIKSNDKVEKSYSYTKILLEISLYLSPNMDISKYLLSELYIAEKSYITGLKKLNQINDKSFFSLAANLKKLSIIKFNKSQKYYPNFLFKLYNKWPVNKEVLYELANFYKLNTNYADALKIYNKLIIIDKENDRALFLYAICLDKLDKWEEAKLIFLNIIKKNKSDPYVFNYLAYSMAIKKEKLDFALILINKALLLDLNNGFFLDTLGWIHYQKNNYETALFYLKKAVILEPSNSEIIDHLADCYFKLGRYNEALYDWKKALKYNNSKDALKLINNKIKKYE